MRTSYRPITALAVVAALGWLAAACGQPKAPDAGATPGAAAPAAATAPAPAAAPPIDPATAIDPAARAAVERMGDYLKGLKQYAIQAETATDEVLLAGPKVQYGGSVDLVYAAPDKLRLRHVEDDEDDQEFYYDGKALSLWIPAKKNWASTPATGPVPDVVDMVESKYDVNFRIGEMLARAARKELLKAVQAGIVVGTGRVGGVECEHLGFHQSDVDWQVWIEKGDRPLPRKVVITTLDEPTQPQFSVVLTWNLSPKIDAGMFSFTPPEGAQRIVIAERTADAAAAKEKP